MTLYTISDHEELYLYTDAINEVVGFPVIGINDSIEQHFGFRVIDYSFPMKIDITNENLYVAFKLKYT